MSYAALPVLGTPRLTLRPLQDDDADAIADGVGNYDVSRWLGAVPYPYGVEDAREYIDTVRSEDQPVWGIEAEGALIGTISTHECLGYWLARPAWRKGYGFEACVAVVDQWFASADAPDLKAGFFQGNDRSEAVMQALGFRFLANGVTFARSLSQEVPSTDMILTRKIWESRKNFTLYTPRLTIRPFEDSDGPALAAMTVRDVAQNMASLPLDMSEAEAAEFIKASRFRHVPGFRLAIEQAGTLVGSVGFGGSPVSLAYFLAREAWGQGVITEALSVFLPEIFDRFPVNRIVADHFEDNPASGAVLRKFGFSETGREMGDSKARLEPSPMITYALTRDTLRIPV